MSKTNQLKHEILQLIESLNGAERGWLPSERQLSEKFGVSRVTVRRALKDLAEKGVITISAGKGSVVNERKAPRLLGTAASFSQDMQKKGKKPGSKVLTFEKIVANRTVSEKLNVPKNSIIYALRRLRLGDDEPMAIECSYIPADIGNQLKPYIDNDISLYKLIEEVCKISIARAVHTIELGSVEVWEGNLLGISPSDKVMLVKNQTFDDSNQVVEYAEAKHRGDKYLFQVELQKL